MADAGLIYRHMVEQFPPPMEGSLRIWWVPQIPGPAFRWQVGSLREAHLLLQVLAGYDDFQYAENVKGDYSNAGALEVYQNGEWEDWCSPENDDFDAWRRAEGWLSK